jgi:hypothetical protein
LDIAADERLGAVWVASVYLPKDYGGYDIPEYSEDRNLTRVDPATNRVVAEIPIGGVNTPVLGLFERASWALSALRHPFQQADAVWQTTHSRIAPLIKPL